MGTIKHWRIYCEAESSWVDWYLPEGETPSTCPNDTAHAMTAGTAKIVGASLNVARTHAEDDALVVKIDPGGPGDDPLMDCALSTIAPGASAVLWYAGDHAADKIFGLIVQARNAEPGDTIEAVVGALPDAISNPSPPPTHLPEGTVVGGFGCMNAPMPESSAGWGTREMRFDQSKLAPAGTKFGVRYTAASGGSTRDFLLDFLMQSPE